MRRNLRTDEKGYIVLRNYTNTSIDSIFAAEDVHDHRYRQAITAAGFGSLNIRTLKGMMLNISYIIKNGLHRFSQSKNWIRKPVWRLELSRTRLSFYL